jgi:extradiol dioxygenase family protein
MSSHPFHFASYVRDLRGEQSTMFLHDESGNAIEMKAFRHPEHVFAE